jgi:hypothetical protein
MLVYEHVCPQIRRPASPGQPDVKRAAAQHRVVREGIA